MTRPHHEAYDLFVSYAHADDHDGRVTALVEEIKRIREDDHPDQPWRVFFDSHALRTMDAWEERIGVGLRSAGVLLVVLSPAYFGSEWCGREWLEFREQRDALDRVAGLYLETDAGYESPADDWRRDLRSRQHLDVRAWRRPALFGLRWLSRLFGRGTALGLTPDRRKKLAHAVADIAGRLSQHRRGEQKTSVSRLPSTGKHVFGRSDQVKVLDDCWRKKDGTNVVCLVGWGGVGKSSLVNDWLGRKAREFYRGAERVYAWSFYDQGTTGRVTSADEFIASALSWFGDPDPTRGSPRDRGERLAGLVGGHRTLLILDGLETLQGAPVPGGRAGKLKDPALAGLLCELAGANRGLCVVTSRLPVADLGRFEASTVRREDLAGLTRHVGRELLVSLGVRGDRAELEAASEEFGGHALALTLLGSYLAAVHGGDIRKRGAVTRLIDDPGHGGHARRVMASYEQWFGAGPELGVLRLMGLFDRPADADAVAALREAPAIPGLTDTLVGLTDARWQQALASLRKANLLADASPDAPGALDTHPLIREHFGEQLREQCPAAWREGNRRLYEHFRHRAASLPENLREMAPLFQAVAHGCEAGLHQEVFDAVYWPRIFRGDYFSTDVLNAFGADLAAVACFFDRDADGRVAWDRPEASLADDRTRVVVLRVAGWDLRSLGRMSEARQALRATADRAAALGDRVQALGSLGQIALDGGDLGQALSDVEEAQAVAAECGLPFWRTATAVLKANVLFQLGRREGCEALRAEVEVSGFPEEDGDEVDHAFIAFRWCDLELGRIVSPCAPLSGRVDPEAVRRVWEEIQARTGQILRIAGRFGKTQLAEAVADLLRGRGLVVRGVSGGNPEDLEQGEALLRRALGELKTRAQEIYVCGLRACVALNLHRGGWVEAEEVLCEAMEVATRSEMKLYLVDAHLQFAWLRLSRGDRGLGRESLDAARALIQCLEYHRRDAELAEIARML